MVQTKRFGGIEMNKELLYSITLFITVFQIISVIIFMFCFGLYLKQDAFFMIPAILSIIIIYLLNVLEDNLEENIKNEN